MKLGEISVFYGVFSTTEMKKHQLKAILFSLKALTKGLKKVHIKVLTDNSTTVACINKLGTSRSQGCDSVTKEISNSANSAIWLSARHLPEKQNTEVDFTRNTKHEIHTEWKLNKFVFHFIYGELGLSRTIDLFATRKNTQLRTLVSVERDGVTWCKQ